MIDAILGPETDNTEVKEPYAGMLVTLKQVKIPIVSVDVPSGICSLNTHPEFERNSAHGIFIVQCHIEKMT